MADPWLRRRVIALELVEWFRLKLDLGLRARDVVRRRRSSSLASPTK